MGCQGRNRCLAVMIFVTIFFGSCSQKILAARPLEGEQWVEKNLGNIQSLQRGPVTPISGSPCTHIPGRGSGNCPLGARNFAGHAAAHAQPAFPDAIMSFAAASATHKQDSSS
ncbi:transcription factor bHLH [Salix suchowensis]|nr:transcription factor bHLH [Salix suchowensis]